jgi:hypothetical protein
MVPAPFRGDWAIAGSACAIGPADSGNIRITATRMISFESLTTIRRATIKSPLSITIDGRTNHGGGRFGTSLALTLSTDHRHLYIGAADSDDYLRCTS